MKSSGPSSWWVVVQPTMSKKKAPKIWAMKLCAFQMNYLLSAVWACFKWYIPLFSHKNVPLSLVDYMVQYILYNYICCFFQLLLIVAFALVWPAVTSRLCSVVYVEQWSKVCEYDRSKYVYSEWLLHVDVGNNDVQVVQLSLSRCRMPLVRFHQWSTSASDHTA